MRKARSEMRIGLIAISFALTAFSCSACSDLTAQFQPKPVIKITPASVDVGTVQEGVEVSTTISVKNEGNAELVIHEAKSSCGCTTADLSKNRLAPNESMPLKVTVDTTMKQGDVTKNMDVSSNDPVNPIVQIPITMHVPNQHKGLSERGKAKILTDEKCMSCHVYAGVGLGGKELYDADCAMCHGEGARGAVGNALIYGDYSNKEYVEHIREVISYGSKTHASMPGFLDKAGGPLVKEQIDSLIAYLKEISEKERAGRKSKNSARQAGEVPANGESENKAKPQGQADN